MDETLNIPVIMATHSRQKALSYLCFVILMLVASAGMTILLMADPSAPLKTRLLDGDVMRILTQIFPGLVLSGGSLFFLHKAIQNLLQAHRLEAFGHRAEGVITHKWVDTLERREVYQVSYRFSEQREAWETISKRLYETLSKGSRVPIRYLQDDPLLSRLDYELIKG